MEKYQDIIINSKLFDGIPSETVRATIIPAGCIKTVPEGSSLFMPRDRVTSIHILLSGRIKLVFYMENGEQDIKSMILPPHLLGIDLICTRTCISPYQASALMKSEVFSFPSSIILNPGILPEEQRLKCINNLLLIISQINMQNEYRLAILTRNGLRDRIMVFLTMQANKCGSDSFSIPFSRDEMASFLRVNRSALSHELSLLKQEGLIDFSKNRFSLLSRKDYDMAIYGFEFSNNGDMQKNPL